MVSLVEIDFDEFKREIYPHYLELFPEDERKPLTIIKTLYEKGLNKIVKIVDNETTVGFLIYNTVKNNKYILLDYFAIFREYQNKQYGSKAIKLFKDFFTDYNGIYGEVEKQGCGSDEKENIIREKRIKFWKKLGFELLNVDLELFEVLYSPCILKLKDIELNEDEIMKSAFEIYIAIHGKEKTKKKCKIIKGSYIK